MKICLIGATHPSCNPRLIREADSLARLGHEVRVVAPSFQESSVQSDLRAAFNGRWELCSYDFREGLNALKIRGTARLSREIYKHIPVEWIGERGFTFAHDQLLSLGLSKPADWFIAHAHGALPIAARCAERFNARLGFDCEDLLSEIDAENRPIIQQIERSYLSQCDYVSVPSKAIANELRHYGVDPVVLYNFFPRYQSRLVRPPSIRRPGPLRLHWFSQTVGSGRGLEEAVEALKILDEPVELSLRGQVAKGYDGLLLALTHGTQITLDLLPLMVPEELIWSMRCYDIGLALERPEHGNAGRTVSNKIGSYMLAGLAIVATDTVGQREVLQDVGFMYPAGNPKALADQLRKWMDDPGLLQSAKTASWNAGKVCCWDVEQEKFLTVLGLGKTSGMLTRQFG